MKSCHSKILRKEVFDDYRHFLSMNHRYHTTKKHIFNGKEYTRLKTWRMTPLLWKLKYNKNHQGMQFVYVSYMKWFEFLFYGFIWQYFITIFVIYFTLHQGNEGINNGISWGMRCYPTQLMKFPSYEEIKIDLLFDTMHIRKNVTKTLWKMIDGKRDKEKKFKICFDIQESNHVMQGVIW